MIRKKICKIDKIEKNNFFKIWIEDFKDEIIVYKYKKKIYVKSSICPHFGGPISYKNDKGYSTAIAYIQKTPEEDPYLEVHYRKVGKDFEQDKEEKIFPVQLREEAVTLYKTFLSKTIL